jgi:hypothetical protein
MVSLETDGDGKMLNRVQAATESVRSVIEHVQVDARGDVVPQLYSKRAATVVGRVAVTSAQAVAATSWALRLAVSHTAYSSVSSAGLPFVAAATLDRPPMPAFDQADFQQSDTRSSRSRPRCNRRS